MRFRIVEKSFPTSKVGYSFVFLKWPNPGSLNASIETKEQINMKARQLLMVKDQENMSCNSPLVSFYKTTESARRMFILILDSLIFKSGFLCAQTWIAKLWLRFHLGFSEFWEFWDFLIPIKRLIINHTNRYQHMPTGTNRCQQVPTGTNKYPQVPTSTHRYPQVPTRKKLPF